MKEIETNIESKKFRRIFMRYYENLHYGNLEEIDSSFLQSVYQYLRDEDEYPCSLRPNQLIKLQCIISFQIKDGIHGSYEFHDSISYKFDALVMELYEIISKLIEIPKRKAPTLIKAIEDRTKTPS